MLPMGDNLRMAITEITPRQARQRQLRGAVLVDVREGHERAGGQAEGALGIARAALEADPAAYLADRETELLLICQGGYRSLRAAQFLKQMGFAQIASVARDTEELPQSSEQDVHSNSPQVVSSTR